VKKIILIFTIILLLNQGAEAQWILQSSFTNNNLYDIEFYNRNTGWAVGDGGTILKTTNGGTNWNNVPNPAVGKPLSSIHIVDSNVCYVVGWFETIIKTTDGGTSWIVIRNNGWGFGSSYDAVFFIDENTGWIAGTGQKILRTTNGCDSIITDYLFTGNLHDMYFKDALTGIVTGSSLGSTFKTTNGGLNWFELNIQFGFTVSTFYKLSFINDQTGWIAGSDKRVYKTTDFGDTWDTISRIPISQNSISMRFAEFIDENTGFVGGEQGYLFKSTNGGYNFQRQNTSSFPPNEIISMHLYSDSIGWMVGGEAKIFSTTNGGQILVNINNSNLNELNKLALFQNYPNPFNSSTKIEFSLAKNSLAEIKIYDIQGKEIKSLLKKTLTAGNHKINFDASGLYSGVYFYSLIINGVNTDMKKMIYLK